MGRSTLAAAIPAIACVSLIAVPALAAPGSSKGGNRGQIDPPGQLVQVQLLGFNDYHGHVLPDAAGQAGGVHGLSSGGGSGAGGDTASGWPLGETAGGACRAGLSGRCCSPSGWGSEASSGQAPST